MLVQVGWHDAFEVRVCVHGTAPAVMVALMNTHHAHRGVVLGPVVQAVQPSGPPMAAGIADWSG